MARRRGSVIVVTVGVRIRLGSIMHSRRIVRDSSMGLAKDDPDGSRQPLQRQYGQSKCEGESGDPGRQHQGSLSDGPGRLQAELDRSP